MTLVPAFVGPSNRLAATVADIEQTLNFCIERTVPGNAKSQSYLRNTPCVQPILQTQTGGTIRAQLVINDRAFAVSGDQFGEVMYDGATWAWIAYGSVGNDNNPASMVSNGTAGNQILIISNLQGFVFDLTLNTLSSALAPDFPADVIMCDFLKGWGFVLIKNTRRYQISALEDFTVWDALDVAEISDAADNVVFMIRTHDNMRFAGNQTGEAWYANGDPLFPFAPVPGSSMENGGSAPFAKTRAENTLFYLAQDERGNGIVVADDGYTPQRISTYAVERNLRESTRLDTATMFTQQDQGHVFIWLVVEDVPTTWVYDATEKLWHERSLWNTTTCLDEPYIAANYMFAFGHSLVGSRLNDVIYELSFRFHADVIV